MKELPVWAELFKMYLMIVSVENSFKANFKVEGTEKLQTVGIAKNLVFFQVQIAMSV